MTKQKISCQTTSNPPKKAKKKGSFVKGEPMSSVTEFRPHLSIPKVTHRTPFISILRLLDPADDDHDALDDRWLSNRKVCLMCFGRVLRFLNLAVDDELSKVGWIPTPQFIELAIAAFNTDAEESCCAESEEDAWIVDMIDGIATGGLDALSPQPGPGLWDRSYEWMERRFFALQYTSCALRCLGLFNDEDKPTDLLKELFARAAAKISLEAPTSTR